MSRATFTFKTKEELRQMDLTEVNAYIRTHTYIDMATAIPTQDGLLPTQYALDGLHPDANGKALMGAYVNSVWPEVKAAADQELEEYESTLQDGAENGAGVLY